MERTPSRRLDERDRLCAARVSIARTIAGCTSLTSAYVDTVIATLTAQ